MSATSFYKPAARVYVAAILAAGALGAGWLASDFRLAELSDHAPSLVVFGSLSLLWSLLSVRAARRRGGRAALVVAPAAYQALFPFAAGWVIVTVVTLALLADWRVHRRALLPGLFNLGQVLLTSAAAVPLARALAEVLGGPLGTATGALAGSLLSSALGLLLLSVALRLASARGPRESGILAYTTLVNEGIVATFSGVIAASWVTSTWLVVFPVVPLTILFDLIHRLTSRENALRRRTEELQALQELGLEVSARLDAHDLARVVVRLIAEDQRTTRALLLRRIEGEPQLLEVLAEEPAPHAPPSSPRLVAAGPLDEEFFGARRATITTGVALARFAMLPREEVHVALARPIVVLEEPRAALLVARDEESAPFSEDDRRRLDALARFVEVALSNAQLYDNLKRIQEHLLQSEKLTAMGQLVSGVAHELNNPLATILGTIQLLELRADQEALSPLLRRIRDEAERSARIVRALLSFSRQHDAEFGLHDVVPILEDVVEMREYDCRTKNIRLDARTTEALPALRVDPHQLRQLLINVVTNAEQAIDASGRGGAISIVASRRHDELRIEVLDTGPGLPPDVQGKVFNPFFTTKAPGEGTGLGLSICFSIVQQHGGRIRAENRPAGGCRVIVDLPLDVPAPPAREPDRPAASELLRRWGEERSILVVDDEPGVRHFLAEVLGDWGFSVEVAASEKVASAP